MRDEGNQRSGSEVRERRAKLTPRRNLTFDSAALGTALVLWLCALLAVAAIVYVWLGLGAGATAVVAVVVLTVLLVICLGLGASAASSERQNHGQ